MFVTGRTFQPSLMFVGVRSEPTRVGLHLSGSQLLGRLLALPAKIMLGWKDLPGTNTLVYYKNSKITDMKSFITLGIVANVIKLFST